MNRRFLDTSLRFGWWNIALSSPNEKSSIGKDYEFFFNHIIRMISKYSLDILSLCEVSEEDCQEIKGLLEEKGYQLIPLINNVGRAYYDIAVIYKIGLKVRFKRSLHEKSLNNNIKVAQIIEVSKGSFSPITLYLCHWPSRIRDQNEKRRTAASKLNIDAMNSVKDGEHVIIMGDFNDDPFDYNILSVLKASRCIETVRKFPKELLYNPFWRYTVPSNRYDLYSIGKTFNSGSYRYTSGTTSEWHLYDQVILSADFLGSSKWYLNEYYTKVIEDDEIKKHLFDKKLQFDHMPIVCEINYMEAPDV